MASPLTFAQDVIRCSLCENSVEYYCNLCHLNLCSACTSMHLSDTIKIHKIVNFTSKIEKHDCAAENDCEIFCRDCEIPVCVTCIVDVHKQHDLTELEVVLQERRNKLADDIKEIECLILPKFQKNTRYFDDEEYEQIIEVIFNREDEICGVVHDFARKLLEKVTQNKKENEEKANQIKASEEKILKDIQETESLLTNGDSEVILQFDGIKREWKDNLQDNEIFVPFLNTNTLQEEDLASLFGQLVFKPMEWKDKKNSIVRGGNLKKEAWFHGCIPREEAEQLLLKDGDFLVRESKNSTESDRCFVISTYRQRPVHFFIRNKYITEKLGPEATVVDYVNFLKSSGEPLSPSNASIPINPIARGRSQLVYDNISINSNERDNKVKNSGMLCRGTFGSAKVFIQMWENQEQAFKNLGLLRKFSHPNIIRLIGYSALESPVLLVMEYLSGGILLSYLRVESVSISKGKRIQMCKDVASGMAYLHHNGFIHRDLAARNCSVDDKRVKISNFRMTEFGNGYQITKTSNIPVKWTAPEVFLLGKYTFFSDVWSFGILMWEIFSSGELPYEGFTNEEIMEKVTSGYKMSAPKGTPKKCDDLMLSCWKRNPDNRYNFSKIEEKLQEIMKKHQTKHS